MSRVSIFKQGSRTARLDAPIWSSGASGSPSPRPLSSASAASALAPPKRSPPSRPLSATEAIADAPRKGSGGSASARPSFDVAAGLVLRPASRGCGLDGATPGSPRRADDPQRADDLDALKAAFGSAEAAAVPASPTQRWAAARGAASPQGPAQDRARRLPGGASVRAPPAARRSGAAAPSEQPTASSSWDLDDLFADEDVSHQREREVFGQRRRRSSDELDADFDKLFGGGGVTSPHAPVEPAMTITVVGAAEPAEPEPGLCSQEAGYGYGSLVLQDVERKELAEQSAAEELGAATGRRPNAAFSNSINRVRSKLRAVILLQDHVLSANMAQDEWRPPRQEEVP